MPEPAFTVDVLYDDFATSEQKISWLPSSPLCYGINSALFALKLLLTIDIVVKVMDFNTYRHI
ncbi:hypothetical protein EXT46_15265 [Pseudoalteromonas sp. CO325X]|uniref:hypothetical protein n=1 Tax=Pseudoalteromonas sp. CO325X TaxID=1777262 RepID=UPI001022A16A|nr:hypothetical protein [Pseudoalteromonas sp. CO325X]RZF78776.1 hypothetical protein EXT46_15265 [Pseudoalteromonas sp. CO325X]